MVCKNLVLGLILLISLSGLACESKIETEKQNSSPAKTESDSSGKKENDSAKADKKIQNEAVKSKKTGAYELKEEDTSNEFNIQELSENRLKVEFAGAYIYEVNGEEMANSGDASGFASLKNDKAEFTPEEMEDCTMTLTFSEKTLEVKDNGKCVFGLNVSAIGTYKKTSDKPIFQDEDVSEK